MYLNFSIPNIITVGVMLLGWMLVLHLLGQAGVHLSSVFGNAG
jgi:TM2 domain-containing membrane protein YozV